MCYNGFMNKAPKRKCSYGGHEILDMEFANFSRQEIREREQRYGKQEPEKCPACDAVRTPQWVKRNLGGPGSGCWQWSLIFPHHNQVRLTQVKKLTSGSLVC